MIGRLRGALLAGVALCLAQPAGAEDSMSLKYRGSIAGISVGTLAATVQEAGAVYRVESRMVTEGPLGLIMPWDYRAISHGRLDKDAPQAQRFWSLSQQRGEPKHIQVTWSGGGATIDSARPDPAEKPKRLVPPDLRRATIDPLSALIAAGNRVGRTGRCAGPAIAIFDGRARYDVYLRDAPAGSTLPAAAQGGPTIACHVSYVPIAGFKEDFKAKAASQDNPALVQFRTVRPGMPAVPARIDVDSQWGRFALELVEASAGPARTAAR